MPYYTNAYWLKVEKYSNKNVYICVDDPYMNRPDNIDLFIGLQCEPNAISNLKEPFIKNSFKFDLLLTFDEDILRECQNSRLFIYGTTWIHDLNIDVSVKKDRISSITGWKQMTDGHKYRQLLYKNQKTINLPIDWYRSDAEPIISEIDNNPILGKRKDLLFLNHKYSLVIENSRQNNYFTEKLCDCLITKTIPIYYGCPNITKWFDTTGWIILEYPSIEELEVKCKDLNYEKYGDTIEFNYKEVQKYVDYPDRIIQEIET